MLSCRISGYTIADCAAMEVRELIAFIRTIKEPAMLPVVTLLCEKLDSMIDIGLDYLSLDRGTVGVVRRGIAGG